MSSVEETGYLSDEIGQWILKHRNENSQWFELCDDINRFAHKTMFTIKIHNKVLKELISSTIYVRAMSNFQGIVLMSERGMVNEAKALTRCLLECMFALVAIEKDENFAKIFVLDDLIQRRDYLKAYKRTYKMGIKSEETPPMEEMERLLISLDKEINENEIKKFTKRDIAVKAELEAIYDTAYKVLSGTVHINARDLEQYLDINQKENVQTILWGPDVKEIDIVLFTAAESMVFVLTALSKVFSLTYNEAWENLVQRYNKLGKDFNAQV